MKKIAKTEEELRIISWWDDKKSDEKQCATIIEFGEKKSYKKLSYEQIKTLYKLWI